MKDARPSEARIVPLRAVFVAFASAITILLVLLTVIHPLTSNEPVSVTVYVMLGAGPVALAFIPWARGKLLDSCGPPEDLAQTYTTTFFISMAFAESAALLGFVATFLVGAFWPYLVGGAVAFVGFVMSAPSASRIRRLDEQLTSRGCQHSLAAGLYSRQTEHDAT